MQDFFFFCLWQLCPSEGWAWRWHSCLGCSDPGGAKCEGTQIVFRQELWPYQLFFFPRPSCSWWPEGLFGQSFSITPPIQALRLLPCQESFSVVWHIRYIEGYPPRLGSYSVDQACQALKGAPWVVFYSVVWCQALDGPASLLFSCHCWPVGRERLWWWLHPLGMTQQYCLAFIAAWLSSTVTSHHNLLPHSLSTWFVSLQSTAALTLGLLHNP